LRLVKQISEADEVQNPSEVADQSGADKSLPLATEEDQNNIYMNASSSSQKSRRKTFLSDRIASEEADIVA
jgi:hypothetical protein